MTSTPLYEFGRRVVFPLTRLIYDFDVKGKENVPKRPSIFACNQTSHLDDAVLHEAIRDELDRPLNFVSLSFPRILFGFLDYTLERLGNVVISGGYKSIAELMIKAPEILYGGSHLGIFPEGRRMKDGNLGTFYNGVSHVAIKTQAEIVPVYLGVRKAKLFGKIPVRIGKPIIPPKTNGNERRADDLTQRIKNAIRELSLT